MNLKVFALAALLFLAHRAGAVVNYTFSQTGSGVWLTYQGTLDTSGLSFQGGLTHSASFLDTVGDTYMGDSYEIENFRPHHSAPYFTGISYRFMTDDVSFSWNLETTESLYSGTAGFGDTFGFYIFSRPWDGGGYTTWLNLPYEYISGADISGGMLFSGQTLQQMGLSSADNFEVLLPGGEKIVGRVPDTGPGGWVVLSGVAAIGVHFLQRRRKSAAG